VFGILCPDGAIDRARCLTLLSLAKSHGMQCTFHRAFDMARDPMKALEEVIALNFGTLVRYFIFFI
jgi:copper homeostasis protein